MPVVLCFSSRQISAHPIRNFRANPSTPGRFDNIGGTVDNIMFQVTSISAVSVRTMRTVRRPTRGAMTASVNVITATLSGRKTELVYLVSACPFY